MSSILEIDSVLYSLDNRLILSDVYLMIKTGEIAAIYARNGAGKSSLMKIIFGSIKAQNSFIQVNNKPKKSVSKLVNYLPQHSFLIKNRKIINVLSDFEIEISEFISLFKSFENKLSEKIGSLSSGEIRIIENYCIIKSKSLFSILDEPFAFLSPLQINQVKELIKSKLNSKGFLITDHQHQFVQEIATDNYILKNGYLKKSKDVTLSML